MHREYVEANKLLDAFATEDREHAKAVMEDMLARLPERVYQRAVYLANQQFRMYDKDYRLHHWRAEWLSEKKRGRAQHGHASTDEQRESHA